MRYSIKPKDRIFVKGYGFVSFVKNMGTHATKVAKNLSNKYSQKLIDSTNKSTTYAIKSASKRVIQKTAEAAGDLIGNEIATEEANNELTKERHISPEKRQQIIDELRLV